MEGVNAQQKQNLAQR